MYGVKCGTLLWNPATNVDTSQSCDKSSFLCEFAESHSQSQKDHRSSSTFSAYLGVDFGEVFYLINKHRMKF